jgi:hypothetical protein
MHPALIILIGLGLQALLGLAGYFGWRHFIDSEKKLAKPPKETDTKKKSEKELKK